MKTRLEASGALRPVAFSLLLILTTASILPLSSPPVAASHEADGLLLQVSRDKFDYLPGEPVHITTSLFNRGTEPVNLVFSSGCLSFFAIQSFDVTVVYDLRLHAVCPTIVVELQVGARETVEIGSFTWNQVDDAGEQVPGGVYTIVGISKFQLCDVTCREFELATLAHAGPAIRIAHLVIVVGSMRGIIGGWTFAAFDDTLEPPTVIYTVPQDIHPVDRVDTPDLVHLAMTDPTCMFPGQCVVETRNPDVTYTLSSRDSFTLTFALASNRFVMEIPSAPFTSAVSCTVTLSSRTDICVSSRTPDLNGDSSVNIIDLALVGRRFGSRSGEFGYNPAVDLNGDEVVNVLDLTIVGGFFGAPVFK